MTTTAPKAYSYLRFSTPEQMKGDSMRRQSALAVEYAARHGLTLDTELTFNDLGVSAYRAKNSETGALGVFCDLAHDGQIPKGSYLLVESLDRVSRTKPRKAVKILERICEAGVNVVTLSDGRVYNEDALDNDGGMSLIMSVLIFVRANEESATKSKRLKAAWSEKRAQAGTTPLSALCPTWLKLNRETGKFEVIEEKAEVVRRIYAMAAEGMGYNAISKKLQAEGVPTLTPRAAYWRFGTVRHLLRSVTVTGAFVPSIRNHVEGKAKAVREYQEPVRNYYPAIVSEELYAQVQALAVTPKRGTWALKNIFGGLILCQRCGDGIHLQTKASAGRKTYSYLVCNNARYGGGCKYDSVPVANVEGSFLRDLERILAGRPTTSGVDERILEGVEAAIEKLEERIGTIQEAHLQQPSSSWLEKLPPLEAELTKLKAQKKSLDANIAATSGPLIERRADGLKAALAETPRDVQKINTVLRAMFTGLTLNIDAGVAILGWRGGGESRFQFQPPLAQIPTVAQRRTANLRKGMDMIAQGVIGRDPATGRLMKPTKP